MDVVFAVKLLFTCALFFLLFSALSFVVTLFLLRGAEQDPFD